MILADEVNIFKFQDRNFIIQVDFMYDWLSRPNFPLRNFTLNIKSRHEYSLRFKPMQYILVKFHKEKFLIQIDNFWAGKNERPASNRLFPTGVCKARLTKLAFEQRTPSIKSLNAY